MKALTLRSIALPLIIIIAILAIAYPAFADRIESQYFYFENGFSAGIASQLAISDDGDITTSGDVSVSGDLSFSGDTSVREFTQGGGILNVATTASAYTLTEAELLANSVIEIETVVGPQAALALTLPATSTWITLLPNAGDMREWLIEDNHGVSGTTTTVTLGTGIDVIAYTTNDDVIDGGEFARLTCWRKETTDIGCITSELVAAD